MDNISQLANSDIFFNYGNNDIETETQADLFTGLLSPSRSLMYDREDSAGIEAYENLPNSIVKQLELRYKIAKWIAYRNELVVNGTEENNKDRRVAVSQASIQITSDQLGNISLLIYYILFDKLEGVEPITIPLPTGA